MSARGGKKKGAKKKAPAWKCAWCPQTKAQTRNECIVCMDLPRAVFFLPCNHCVVCASCADALQECPFCNVAVAGRITMANSS